MRSARTVIGRESQWPSFLFANKWPAPLSEAGHRCLCLVLLFLYYFVHCVHTVLLSKESARVIEIGVFRGYPKPAYSQWTHASRWARYRPRSDSPESKQTCVNFRQLVAAQGYEPSCRRAVHEERPDRVQAVELRMQSIAAILGREQRVGVGES